MSLLDIVFLSGALLVILWLILFRKYKALHHLFKYEKSKQIRCCRICKQQQNLFEDEYGHFKWEDIGEIKNPDCICHKYSTR